MNSPLLTVAQAAARLQLSRSMLYSLIESQRIECVRFGAAIRFTPESVDALIAACTVPARAEGAA